MAHNATKAALSTWAGALSDRVGRRAVIVGGWALYALVYLGFGLRRARLADLGALRRLRRLLRAHRGRGQALVADLAPAHARGRAFGWYNAAVGIVALPASLGFGALADRFGARVPFTVSALLAVAASAWLVLLVRPRPAR